MLHHPGHGGHDHGLEHQALEEIECLGAETDSSRNPGNEDYLADTGKCHADQHQSGSAARDG